MLPIIFTYTIRGSIDFHLDFVFVFTDLIGLHVYIKCTFCIEPYFMPLIIL